jgi:hypothetical protein
VVNGVLVSTEIIPAVEYAARLRKTYEGIEVPLHRLRELFSTEEKVFFNCANTDKSSCLHQLLAKPDFSAFRIYLVVKDATGYSFMDVNFRNIRNKETLEHFMKRYHQQLENMARLSLQGSGQEYVECIGHGYEETTP